MMRKLTVSILTVALMMGASADAGTPTARYHKRSGPGPRTIIIRHDCLGAEDSAAHLRLVDYSGSRVVYGCRNGAY